jgi:hypothetical protein
LGGGVHDLVARLRWHQGQSVLGSADDRPPTLGGALRDRLAGDALAEGLLASDRRAFAELDVRAAELVARADACDRARARRDFHRTQVPPLLPSLQTAGWRVDAAADGDPRGDGSGGGSNGEGGNGGGNGGGGDGLQSAAGPRCRPASAGGPEVCSLHPPLLAALR